MTQTASAGEIGQAGGARHGVTFKRQLAHKFPYIPTMSPKDQDKLLKMPKRERLALAERLWLSVADENDLEVPAAHKAILKTRLADYKSGKSKPISHEELMRRVRAA